MASIKSSVKSKQYAQNSDKIEMKLKERFVRQRECDLHFIVGPKRVRMSAHKSVVSLSCRAFDRLIAKVDGRVLCKITNISADNFKAMLRFIYGFSITITESNVIQLNNIAHKYDILTLRNICRDFYLRIVNKDNALQYLCTAVEWYEQDLINLCMNLIDENTTEMIASQQFYKLNLKTLAMILERNELNVKEVDLLKALINWAKFQCIHHHIEPNSRNLLKYIDKCIYLIRYPLINLGDISHILTKSGLYNTLMYTREFHQLLNKMNTKKRGFKQIHNEKKLSIE